MVSSEINRTMANQNKPSKLYVTHLGCKVLLEDQRYCGGHKSIKRNGHKVYSRILRSQLKREASKMIYSEI
jgi:hypothetical protein